MCAVCKTIGNPSVKAGIPASRQQLKHKTSKFHGVNNRKFSKILYHYLVEIRATVFILTDTEVNLFELNIQSISYHVH